MIALGFVLAGLLGFGLAYVLCAVAREEDNQVRGAVVADSAHNRNLKRGSTPPPATNFRSLCS